MSYAMLKLGLTMTALIAIRHDLKGTPTLTDRVICRTYTQEATKTVVAPPSASLYFALTPLIN